MFFPVKPNFGGREQKTDYTKTPVISTVSTLLAVFVAALVGIILLVDQQLETNFVPSEIVAFDRASRQVRTENASFLAALPMRSGRTLEPGKLLILELSPITRTVVTYKLSHKSSVELPRESIFSYWPITAIMTVLSLTLLVFGERLKFRAELLVIDLILLIVIALFYITSH